jgi:biopolymer transport protein ExbD
MAIKRKNRFHAGVEASSMTDIMFFLLLFFLIISTLSNPNVIKVPLPNSKPTGSTNKQHLTLTINMQDGKELYYLDKELIITLPKSGPERVEKLEILENRLKEETAVRMDQTVVIRPARDAEVQLLIDVLQIGLRNQLKFLIATNPG